MWPGSSIPYKKGANINFQDKTGKTASILAAKADNSKILELLFQNGADFALKDCTKNSPIDFAYKLQHIASYQYISKVSPNPYQSKILPDYLDGPYFFLEEKAKVKQVFLKSDYLSKTCYSIDSIIQPVKNELYISGKKLPFGFTLRISKKIKPNPGIYSGIKKWMAIGDLHGGFDEFCKLLISHNIMDQEYNWIFGDGHLVVAGDIFDRGTKVTECLWLLYKLEAEAEKHNGKVHFLLGNHEIMQLSGDKRYLSEKYLDLFNQIGYNYSEFYEKQV
jgi:hypothetical protein